MLIFNNDFVVNIHGYIRKKSMIDCYVLSLLSNYQMLYTFVLIIRLYYIRLTANVLQAIVPL